MPRPAFLLLVSALAAAVSGEAWAQPDGPISTRTNRVQLPHCIETSFSPNWRPVNDHTIIVEVGAQTFRVTTNQCPTLTSPLPRISTKIRGGSSICSPQDVQLYVSESGDRIPAPCFVQSIQQISPAEARGYDRRH